MIRTQRAQFGRAFYDPAIPSLIQTAEKKIHEAKLTAERKAQKLGENAENEAKKLMKTSGKKQDSKRNSADNHAEKTKKVQKTDVEKESKKTQ